MRIYQYISTSGVSKFIPRPIKVVFSNIKKMLVYENYDSTEYWRKRASCSGQAAVLWKNQGYNELYRADQGRIVEPWVRSLPQNAAVLDIGCGIGIVASMIRSMRQDVSIDAVDFEEMIAIAREKTEKLNINYVASSSEEFIGLGYKYNLIISSGCYSAIRDIAKLKKSLKNGANMLADDGIILMIDPFHRWNFLARAKFNTNDVVTYLRQFGLSLTKKSGVLFWPFRVLLSNSDYSGLKLETQYRRGERLLKILGQHFWADYKVLIFKKTL